MLDHVRPAELDDWLARHRGADASAAVMLDVREPWELQTASVQPDGFELVAIPMGQLMARLGELDPERPLACLCHHGTRSLRVAAFLAQNGFARVANVSGGIDAWSRERDTAIPVY